VTGDVQSVSLLAIRVFPRELVLDPAVQTWINRYKVLSFTLLLRLLGLFCVLCTVSVERHIQER
jgi:hypothetical protein